MNSKILDKLGLDFIDPAYYFLGLLLLCIILLIYVISVNRKFKKIYLKYDRFMRGKTAESLEELMEQRFEDIDRLLEADRKKSKHIQNIYENLKITYQKMGIIKYDAFQEMGGELSFALALLDKNDTGFIINAMHSREGCYTYVKEIINGESAISLGEEEQIALDRALGAYE